MAHTLEPMPNRIPGEPQAEFLHRVHLAQQKAPLYRTPVDTCQFCNPNGYLAAISQHEREDAAYAKLHDI